MEGQTTQNRTKENNSDQKSMKAKTTALQPFKWVFFLLISVTIVVCALLFRDKLSEFRSLGLFGVFLINLLASATIFIPSPGIATIVAGGAVYPPVAVAFAGAFGASLGEFSGFFLGHSGTHMFFAKEQHDLYVKAKKIFRKYGDFALFAFAFVPNPFFDAIGILAGLSGFSPIRFFAIIFTARLLRDIILATLGARL